MNFLAKVILQNAFDVIDENDKKKGSEKVSAKYDNALPPLSNNYLLFSLSHLISNLLYFCGFGKSARKIRYLRNQNE
jgi:geranylgeranyl pyrophosphate synthase